MITRLLLVCIISLILKVGFAQPPFKNWDSFYHIWDSLEQADDTYFDYLEVEQWQAEFNRLNSLFPIAKDNYEQYRRDYLEAYFIFFRSDYTLSIPLYKKLLSGRSRMSENELRWCLVNLEESYRRTGNLKEAIPITKERVDLGFDDDFFHIYEEAGLYREAIVEYMEHNDLPKVPIRALGYYSRLGRLLKQDGQLDSAIYYYELAYQEGLKIIDKEEYPGKSAHFHRLRKYYTYQMRGEIGLIYVEQGKYEDAIPLLLKDIATCKEVNEIALTVPKRLGLAEAFLALGNRKRSRLHLDTARQINKETDWVVHEIKYLQIAGKYHFEGGQFDSAAIFFQTSNLLSDSINAIQRENKLIATTAFLDNERQGKVISQQRYELGQAERAQAQQRLQLTLLLAGIVIVMLVAIFLYIDAKRKKKAQELALRDKEIISRQAQKLQELDKVKTRFFSNISHEFRTPLTLIQGPIESILLGRVSGEEIGNNLKLAIRNVKNLRNLIDEILDFNKMDLGNLDIKYVPVVINAYLDEVSENYQSLAREKLIYWELNHELPNKLQLQLPIDKVDKILQNLLSNAFKHSPKNQTVSLLVTYKNEKISFAVKDQGKGIDIEEQDKIFERFYQATEGKLMPHSSGIGLAYVKELTEVLGGNIELKSEPGQGSIFTFTLAASVVNTSAAPKEVFFEQEGIQTSKYIYPNNKILLAEDNEEMAKYIQQVLGDEFETIWAENGKEALDKLEDFDADLIISDIMMPVMDGLELLESLKSHDDHKYKSVIMLTAKSSQSTRLDALSFGLDDYLTKPFNPLELEYRVKNLLRNQYERSQFLKENKGEQKSDDPLINSMIEEIERHLENKNYGVLDLSNSLAMSDRQLTRITKKSIGLTPANLIKEVKLQKSKEYLETKLYRSVAEVSYSVGFEKPSYFSKIFFERFGKKPSEYF